MNLKFKIKKLLAIEKLFVCIRWCVRSPIGLAGLSTAKPPSSSR